MSNIAPLLSALFKTSLDGHSLKFLAYEGQQDLLQSIDESNIVWIKGKRLTGYQRVLWEYQNMARIVRREEIDVIFYPYQIGCRVRGRKQVLMLSNMEPFLCGGYVYSLNSRLRNYLLRQLSVRSLRRADRVIAISEYVRDYLTNGIGVEGERVHTVHHGRNEKLSSDEDEEKDRNALKRYGIGNYYILTCGSLLPYRRCEDVIAAFNKWADSLHAGTQLVIAGAGTDRRYGKLINHAITASPYRDRILALGHVPLETMAALYRSCLLCVLATEIEACPNIAIEAMTAGCVIVSSNRPPLPEMFGGASLEYHARDIDHLVEQIRRCIDQEDLRREMKIRALRRAKEFSWEKCAKETYAALTDWQDKN